MKGTKSIGLLVVLGIILILVFMGCGGYNGLVKEDENVKKSWGNVQTEYQKRNDLVGNLVNTVRAENAYRCGECKGQGHQRQHQCR